MLPPNDPRHTADHQLVLPIPHVTDMKAQYFQQYLRPPRTFKFRYWLVVFYTTWCGVCDELVDPLREISAKLSHRKTELTLAKHNVSPNEAVAHRYDIKNFPTIVLFSNENDVQGNPKYVTYSGERTVAALSAFIRKETSILLPEGDL